MTRKLSTRKSGLRSAALALTLAAGLFCTACDQEAAGRAFRDAATTGLQTGITSILTGMVDGAFAVFQLNADGSNTSGDGTSATG